MLPSEWIEKQARKYVEPDYAYIGLDGLPHLMAILDYLNKYGIQPEE